MGASSAPTTKRRFVCINCAKSYRIRNLRNLAMGVAAHTGTPRPLVPAPATGSPCPLAGRSMDNAGSSGYARAREESAA
jgi:hypothetical protein